LRGQNAVACLIGQSKIDGLSAIFNYLVNETHENMKFSDKSIIKGLLIEKTAHSNCGPECLSSTEISAGLNP
jgi:hypothetical protein